MKDCTERKSFETQEDAMNFGRWMSERRMIHGSVPWLCRRCDRWHLSPGKENARKSRHFMRRERCLSDLDLHLQLARVSGCSLDTLQIRTDLSKTTMAGPSIQLVKVAKSKKPWED